MTTDEALVRVLAAYDELVSVAEGDEDEWSYVMDLSASWRARLESWATDRGTGRIAPLEQAALERAIDEVARISDPYRAVDWLSTFPQVVLTAVGDQP